MKLVENIKTLLTLKASNDNGLGEINDAAILINEEKIFWCGARKEMPEVQVDETIDAEGHLVLPGLIDCHTHLIFAGSRADEFRRRMNHESYLSIMEKGGGITSTVNRTRQASDEELLVLAKARADKIIKNGVTTLEAKSGYGLSLLDELRALRLIKTLDENHPLDFHPTFLGAHVVPSNFKDTREKYVALVMNEMLVQIARERLAIDCDVFCEKGAFSLDEARRILSFAEKLGLGLRAHVQQLSFSGGISLVKDLPIKSISHADFLSDEDVTLLAKYNTVVEALPFAALFLRSSQITPVMKLKEAGVKLAVATDFNPGSAMCHDLVLAARLAITYFGFSIDDAVLAITAHAAKSLGRADIGVIEENSQADLLITNCKDIAEFFYDWTKHPTEMVIKRGCRIK